jgi:hypothetical protein
MIVGLCGFGHPADAAPPLPELRFQSLALGPSHSCGITLDNDAYCWGGNSDGQLGVGDSKRRTKPHKVQGAFKFVELTIAGREMDGGGVFTCGRTPEGRALCWGDNSFGQLGDGTREPRKVPTAVADGIVFRALLAHGFETCGVEPNGLLDCWGALGQDVAYTGNYGLVMKPGGIPLLKGAQPSRLIPIADQGLCVLDANGSADCWRMPDRRNITGATITPAGVQFSTLSLGLGVPSPCGITRSGDLMCWGVLWATGGGPFKPGVMLTEAVHAVPDRKFKDLAAGPDGWWAIDADGGLYHAVARRANLGGFGKGLEFAPVLPGQSFRGLAMRPDHAFGCALGSDGGAWCLDANAPGPLAPSLVGGGIAFASLVTRRSGACGLTAEGRAFCWGENGEGEVGDGSRRARATPTPVAAPERAR